MFLINVWSFPESVILNRLLSNSIIPSACQILAFSLYLHFDLDFHELLFDPRRARRDDVIPNHEDDYKNNGYYHNNIQETIKELPSWVLEFFSSHFKLFVFFFRFLSDFPTNKRTTLYVDYPYKITTFQATRCRFASASTLNHSLISNPPVSPFHFPPPPLFSHLPPFSHSPAHLLLHPPSFLPAHLSSPIPAILVFLVFLVFPVFLVFLVFPAILPSAPLSTKRDGFGESASRTPD